LFPKKDKADKAKIHFAPAAQTFDVNGHNLTLTIEDAQYRGEELLDDIVIEDMFRAVVDSVGRKATKYNPLPTSIVISHCNEEAEKAEAKPKSNNADAIRSFSPRWTLDDVCVDEATKGQILSALTIIQNQSKLYIEWGLGKIFKQNRSIVLNFYGKPGTGKTMMAEAIASHLGKNVYQVNYAELESKYVGETPKNIVEVFKKAQADDAVLVFDELPLCSIRHQQACTRLGHSS